MEGQREGVSCSQGEKKRRSYLRQRASDISAVLPLLQSFPKHMALKFKTLILNRFPQLISINPHFTGDQTEPLKKLPNVTKPYT